MTSKTNTQIGLIEQVSNWMPTSPYQVVSFDCDATLSELEGINVLADQCAVGEAVHKMTQAAMRETGIAPELYSQRLELVRPTASQSHAIGDIYFAHRTPDADTVIDVLQRLGKRVYVLSAGLLPCVRPFAEKLNIPTDQIFAVDCYFDEQGEYRGYEEDSLLTRMDGKAILIHQLCPPHERVVHVGDGMNDVAMAGKIAQFIGFGGGQLHEKIERRSDKYVIANTFTALLPLMLTAEEALQLNQASFDLFEQGCQEIINQQVLRKGTVIDDDDFDPYG